MWWHLSASLAAIHVNNLLCINREVPVRIDDHAEEARVGLEKNHKSFTSLLQIRCTIKTEFMLCMALKKYCCESKLFAKCEHT